VGVSRSAVGERTLPQKTYVQRTVTVRPTALLIDDDVNGTAIFSWALRQQGFDVLTAEDGRAGASMASRGAADVVLLDLKLPDLSGLEVLRLIRRTTRTVPVIMMTAYRTTQSVVQAMRLGAVDYLEKPLTTDELLNAVRAALGPEVHRDADRAPLLVCHASARWADAVAQVIDAPEDPRTLELWGRYIGASRGSLRNWCRMAGLSPKRSLNVARMIRAITQASPRARLEDMVNVMDRRTLRQLLKLGDPSRNASDPIPATVDEFLARQRWISNPVAVDELRRTLFSKRMAGPIDEDDGAN
jgi:CheY-like chemotaxis protein